MFKKVFLPLVSLYLFGCAVHSPIPSPKVRTEQAALLAQKAGWHEYTIRTGLFHLKAYGSAIIRKEQQLTIYIEGDGLAWLSDDRPSDNPTPIVPTGLNIALNDKTNAPLVYLARPCQFVLNEDWSVCQQDYWTHLRFAPEVIEAMNQAVDHLKKVYQVQNIQLIGYSGGGTIATLLAARRHDVSQLITFSAPLDIAYWARSESISPLYGSLNPADFWSRLIAVPQIHWVGGRDVVVPKEVAFSFAKRFPRTHQPKIKVVSHFDHSCCWASAESRGVS